ncbi:hypothetical protein DPEC_G00327310 [Dallia pectoralis]|uniref:Uncharacterized protein n=1 Tax=Dallia pectoralis TaxID=75939 RepID=A0ACC2F7Z5_DALPE|nr:hypothetical protein DPEC_G00327310 [Dallia pectoralis]
MSLLETPCPSPATIKRSFRTSVNRLRGRGADGGLKGRNPAAGKRGGKGRRQGPVSPSGPNVLQQPTTNIAYTREP